jgi:hypothetical protein
LQRTAVAIACGSVIGAAGAAGGFVALGATRLRAGVELAERIDGASSRRRHAADAPRDLEWRRDAVRRPDRLFRER